MARTDNKVTFTKSASPVAAAALWLVFAIVVMMSDVGNAERVLRDKQLPENFVEEDMKKDLFVRVIQFFWQSDQSSYQHVWPVSICIHLSYTTLIGVYKTCNNYYTSHFSMALVLKRLILLLDMLLFYLCF